MNPYIVKLSIVDDEPTLDVSMLSLAVLCNCRIINSQPDVGGPYIRQIIKALTDTLNVFLFQGMGMVVHQALTEYNR